MDCSNCGKEIKGCAVMSPTIDEKKRHMCPECAKKEMGMHIFHVQGGGDSDVGLNDTDANIMLIDNLEWDEDMNKQMKSILAEFYDVPEHCVQTDDEKNRELEYERELEADFNANEEKNEDNN